MTTKEQYAILHEALNEKQWRRYLATEAQKTGVGGQSIVAKESGSDRKTIRKGILELDKPYDNNRIRIPGGGKKKIQDEDITLVKDLEKLIALKNELVESQEGSWKNLFGMK